MESSSNCNGTRMYTPDTQISKASARDKGENILVFARVRPMNNHERSKTALSVIDCPGSKEVVVRERTNASSVSKTFTFDRVFGPLSKQIDVYKAVVSPLLEEVLCGYNCTVFAYGQTGTGKTFTMEGDRTTPTNGDAAFSWESDPLAGIVPRAMSQLFDELRVANSEFTVRVSLVEMYNEEVYDLLSPTEDAKPRTVRLYEDSSKKGSVHIQGLEEVIVHNKHEVYAIMERGSQMRKTASTLLNANSSRSHTVFTVTVHIKETNVMGEDLVKIGKLHLVDLAGSENIGRSGAVDKRAREAGNINQSLLTLGRVITALVERAPHIPYRESKLTRLLQDSLGGRTKTSIIATVSPASINLEETLSTLDYAHRAKNIQNRPEVNQKLTKKAMLKEYTEEIERLRRDLLAAREKNGIYVDKENYEHMMSQIESQGQDLTEKIQYTRSLEEQVQQKDTEISEVNAVLGETREDLNAANVVNESLRTQIINLETKLADTENKKDEMEHLVQVRSETESKLTKEAKTLLSTASETTVNLNSLHQRLERKKAVETSNREAGQRFRGDFDEQLKVLARDINNLAQEHSSFSGDQRFQLEDFLGKKELQLNELGTTLTAYTVNIKTVMDNISVIADNQKLSYQEAGEQMEGYLKKTGKKCNEGFAAFLTSTVLPQTAELLQFFKQARDEVSSIVKDVKKYVHKENTTVDEFIKTRVLSFSEQITIIKNLANSTATSMTEFKSNCGDQHKQDTELILEMSTDAKAVSEMVQHLMAKLDSLQQSRNQEKQYVDSHVNTHIQLVDANMTQVLDKLNRDIKESEELPTALIQLGANTIEKMDARKDRINTIQMQNVKVVKTMEQETRNVVNFGDKMWQDVQTHISEEVVKGQLKVNLQTDQLRIINNQLKQSQDEHKSDTTAKLSQGLQMDRNLVEKSSSAVFSNCDSISRSAEEFQQRIHMQSGKLNEFWDSTYLIDLPTGATPQRKAYDFPRNLTATSPHERILGRFRDFRRRLNADSDFSEADGSEREASPLSVTARSESTSSGPDTPRSLDDVDVENVSPVETGFSNSLNDVSKLSVNISSKGLATMGPPVSKKDGSGSKGLTRSASDLASSQSQSKLTNGKKGLGSAEQMNKRMDKIPNKSGRKVLTTPNQKV